MRMWSNWNLQTLFVVKENGKMTSKEFGNSVKKKAGIAFSYDPVILILSKRRESICSQKDMYMNIYSSCVYNNQSGNNPSDHQQVNAN